MLGKRFFSSPAIGFWLIAELERSRWKTDHVYIERDAVYSRGERERGYIESVSYIQARQKEF